LPAGGFVIVTADSDFYELATTEGPPRSRAIEPRGAVLAAGRKPTCRELIGNGRNRSQEQNASAETLIECDPDALRVMLVNVTNTEPRSGRLIRQADRLCIGVHALAWLVAAATWVVSWFKYGPAPSGPLYNSGFRFIGRLDVLVNSNVQELTIKAAQFISALFKVDIQPCFTLVYSGLILVAGTLQWFLLGRLVQWIDRRGRRYVAAGLLVLLAAWCLCAGLLLVLA
jgi:hypothetical protein